MAQVHFSGTFTALVTPFTKGAENIDHEALERLVEAQLAGGVSGLVPCGTTGETPTLSDAEQVEVIERVAKVVAGRVPVLAGAGGNDTSRSILSCQAALKAGADAVMVVMPYYNKPSQAGMVAHVSAVAAAVDAPVVAYNVPGRSVVDLSAEATEQLCAKAPNVVAVKDATGNVARCQELKRRLGERLTVMCGDDALTLGMMACGADGVISVSANVLPAAVSAVTSHIIEGRWLQAREQHLRLLPFHRAMFAEPNPAPCKAALAASGAMLDEVRLPLLAVSAATRERVTSLMNNFQG